MSHIQLNYAFLLFWSIFGEIHRELLFLIQKLTISEKSTEILRKFVFLNKFEKGKIRRKIWICLNNFFDQTIKSGQILTKTVFLLKSQPHTAKLCFSVVWSIFGEIHRELHFLEKVTQSEQHLSPKVSTSQKRALRNTQKVCFS